MRKGWHDGRRGLYHGGYNQIDLFGSLKIMGRKITIHKD